MLMYIVHQTPSHFRCLGDWFGKQSTSVVWGGRSLLARQMTSTLGGVLPLQHTDVLLISISSTFLRCSLSTWHHKPAAKCWRRYKHKLMAWLATWKKFKTIIQTGQKNCRPTIFSPLDPVVNVSCKNCCVGSISQIFHLNMMIIYYSRHKLTSFLN